MIENQMIIGNRHDSVINDFKDHCKSCSKEIYFGEEFWDIDGDYIHDERECINRYVESHFTKMIAGE